MMKKKVEEMSFEQAMEELKSILEKMEAAQLPLEEAVSAYEYSIALKKHCEEKLKKAQLRVENMTGDNTGIEESLHAEE